MRAIKLTVTGATEWTTLSQFTAYINLESEIAAVQLDKRTVFVATEDDAAMNEVERIAQSRFCDYEIENLK